MNSKAALMRWLVILWVVSPVFLAGCGGNSSQSVNNQPPPPSGSNPTPAITTISPNSAAAGGAAFTLTINGTNFVAASMVNFGGTARTTTFVSAMQLNAAIPASAIASAGTAAVTVTNPAPGGGTSNTVNFTITSGTNPVPTINSLSPTSGCVPAGGPAFTLFVGGSNFVVTSVVRWNGSDRPTTFVSSSQVTAQISASDIAAAGTAAVTVFNPAPGGGTSNSLTFTIAIGGVHPQSVVVDPSGKFAYVANFGCFDFVGNVSMYTINSTTGALTSIGPPVAADFRAKSVTVDPSGKFAYVANEGDGDTSLGSVSMYTINAASGALTSMGKIEAVCGDPSFPFLCDGPDSVAVHPSGKFAYVSNEGGFSDPTPPGGACPPPSPGTPGCVSMFTIEATTGALTSIGATAAGGRPVSVTVDPSGKFAYVADGSTNSGGPGVNVSMYSINTNTGALTSVGTIAAGLSPSSIAIDPSGKFAYVANSGSNNVSMYTINTTTGALTSIGLIPAGTGPVSVAVDPTSKFAYVTNSGSNDVSIYSIDATTGALTSIGTIAAGLSPSSIAIHPSGNFAYVANAGSNNISIYSIDAATGVLTFIGTIGT